MRESKLWFWHILSAVVILVLLGVHMGIMHLGAILSTIGIGSGDPLQSAEVFHRSQQLIYMITYILLLGAALFHGLYGLRSMLFELSLSEEGGKSDRRIVRRCRRRPVYLRKLCRGHGVSDEGGTTMSKSTVTGFRQS